MRNITVTLDDETARWARVEAAQRDMSVSRLIREVLRDHMRKRRTYERAMRSYLSRPPVPLSEGGSYPSREDLHDRADLR
jgi:hypothetical protein